MKTLYLLLIFNVFLSINIINAQGNMPDHSYNRIALTIVYVDDPNTGPEMTDEYRRVASDFFSNASIVPDKYDDHSIPTRIISFDLSYPFNAESDPSEILNTVYKESIPRQMVEKWFQRSEEGTFSMDLIKQRGRYNATDNDYLISAASQRQKSALEDMGEKLISKSYLVLINYSDIQASKNSNGKIDYKGFARGLVYKLVWNDSISSVFYNDLWINESDDKSVKNLKKIKFENSDFKVEYIGNVTASKNQLLTVGINLFNDTEKLEMLMAQLGAGIMDRMVNVNSDFVVKQHLISSDPIAATIGSKEGLYVDQRFFVYETTQNNRDQLVDRRRSVIRVKKVSFNQNESSGNTEPSVFYRVAGGKIDHYGMFIKEKNDLGFSAAGYKLFGGIGGYEFSVNYNISSALSKYLKINIAPGIHVFGDYGNDSEYYEDVAYDGNEEYSFSHFSVGLLKDYYFMHKLHCSFKLGYGQESTELTGSKEYEDQVNFSGQYILAGTKLGINLLHNLQLISGLNYFFPFGKATLKYGSDDSVKDENTWNYYFPDRKGLSLFAGIKIII